MVIGMSKRTGIFVTVRFWTDDVYPGKKIVPKKAWAAGSLYLQASEIHGIKPTKPVIFNNLEELMLKLDELLKSQGITLVMQSESGEVVARLGKGYPAKSGPWYQPKKS